MGTVGAGPEAVPSRPETVLVGASAGSVPVEPTTDGPKTSARTRVRLHASTVAAIVIVVGVAVALRIWVLRSPLGRADSDEAVVGLMARAILHGHHPTFFWGQSYGGTLEPGLVAAAFAVLGQSVFSLKFVPLALCALASVLVWRVGRRIIDPERAALAGALILVYPAVFIWWSTKERGFYWASLVLALLGMLLALQIAASSRAPSAVRASALGLVIGLGWWTSPQTIFVLAPTAVWLAFRLRRRTLALWPALGGIVVGALPWISWNANHSLASLREPNAAVSTTYLHRLGLFFTRLLPTTLGLRHPFGSWVFGPAIGITLYAAALAAFAWLCVITLRQRNSGRALLVLIAVAYPFLFAAPTTSYYVADARYALMLAPIIVLLIASIKVRREVFLAIVAVASVVAIATVQHTVAVANANPMSVDLHPPTFGGLEKTLDELHASSVYADYWIAYPLTFDTNERIIASPVDAVRNGIYASAATNAPQSTYVVFRDRARDLALQRALAARDIPAHRIVVDQFSVYQLDRRVQPSELATVWALPSP